jgi:hypothetical protein
MAQSCAQTLAEVRNNRSGIDHLISCVCSQGPPAGNPRIAAIELQSSHPECVLRSDVFGTLADHALRLSRRSERVVIKVPDSAGSAGNLSLSSSAIQSFSAEALRKHLIQMLKKLGWDNGYPLLVELWDSPVLASPSVQTWIPHRRIAAPILERIFEQVVAGPTAEFVGSVPATVPDFLEALIAEEALKLATLFQHLGYFGRCSFDAVIAGCDYSSAALHWIECNGRWGGVSVPMTLANRLTSSGSRNLIVVQRDKCHFAPTRFSTALDRLGPIAFRVGQSPDGVVILSPSGIEHGDAVQFMALAGNAARARNLAEQAAAILTSDAPR